MYRLGYYGIGPNSAILSCDVHMVHKENMRTHRMTNFDGLSVKTGKRKKQMTKQARAPKLQAPNIIKRSHLLTVGTSPRATKSAVVRCDGLKPTARIDIYVPLIVRHGASSSTALWLAVVCKGNRGSLGQVEFLKR